MLIKGSVLRKSTGLLSFVLFGFLGSFLLSIPASAHPLCSKILDTKSETLSDHYQPLSLEDLAVADPDKFFLGLLEHDVHSQEFRNAVNTVSNYHIPTTIKHFEIIAQLPNDLQVLAFKNIIRKIPKDKILRDKIVGYFFKIDFKNERQKIYKSLVKTLIKLDRNAHTLVKTVTDLGAFKTDVFNVLLENKALLHPEELQKILPFKEAEKLKAARLHDNGDLKGISKLSLNENAAIDILDSELYKNPNLNQDLLLETCKSLLVKNGFSTKFLEKMLDQVHFKNTDSYYQILQFFISSIRYERTDQDVDYWSDKFPARYVKLSLDTVEKIFSRKLFNSDIKNKFLLNQLYAELFDRITDKVRHDGDRVKSNLREFNFEELIASLNAKKDFENLNRLILKLLSFKGFVYSQNVSEAIIEAFQNQKVPKSLLLNNFFNLIAHLHGFGPFDSVHKLKRIIEKLDLNLNDKIYLESIFIDAKIHGDKDQVQLLNAKNYVGFIDRQLFAIDPFDFIKSKGAHLEQIQTLEELKETLIYYGFTPKEVALAFDKVKRREVGLWLSGFVLDNRYADSKDSIELLKRVTGLRFQENQMARLSNDTLGNFFETIIEFYKAGARESFFKKIDPSMFEKERIHQLIDTLTQIRSLTQLKVAGQSLSLEEIITELQVNTISPENIVSITNMAKNSVTEGVKKLFQEHKFDLNFDELIKLNEDWGDLSPIWVLIARFQHLHPNEVGVIAQIMKASLEGHFHEYKFAGVTPSQKEQVNTQLKMISAEDRKKWANPEVIVRPAASATELNSEKRMELYLASMNQLLKTNLAPHWIEYMKGFDITPEKISALQSRSGKLYNQWIDAAKSYDGDPNLFFDKMNVSKVANKLKILSFYLQEICADPGDIQTIKKLAKIIKFSLLQIDGAESTLHGVQLLEDLKELLALTSNQSLSDAHLPKLIATVKTSDPKLLLTIGDCVNASSCQNYKTGSVIRTLPGYVIDANVQAVLSYELNSGNFDGRDFQTVSDWIRSNKAEISFDGNLKKFKFVNGDQIIFSKPLDKAFLRNILKIGEDQQNHQPGLFLERDYSQTHPNIIQMQQQHREILNSLAQSIGAVTHGQITVYKSRNPEGHYSDSVGGVQTKDYTVSVP